MNQLMTALENNIDKIEFFSYFSSEILCIFGIILNIIAYLFLNKKLKIRKISNGITSVVFVLNSILLLASFIKNNFFVSDFSLEIFNNTFIINCENILYKFFINLFLALFVLATWKLNKKARFSTTLMNACLLFLSIVSGLLVQVENAILSFLFLDLSAFFIYKYASNTRLRKYSAYSVDFILISALSTFLFYSFFFLFFIVRGPLQIGIIQICCACAILLKAGLFPLYNYILCKNTKNNLAFCALLFAFLPFLGVISFLKFSQNIGFNEGLPFIVVCIFLIALILTSAFGAFREKNLIRYFANCAYCYFSLYILASLFLHDIQIGITSALVLLFVLFSLYCLLFILEINLKINKINYITLKGLFIRNKKFVNIFALLLLVFLGIIPSVLFVNNIEIIKGIYEFDKLGSYILIMFLFANVLIILNALKIIKTSYSINTLVQKPIELTKRTTFLYVVPVVIITLLIVEIFL